VIAWGERSAGARPRGCQRKFAHINATVKARLRPANRRIGRYQEEGTPDAANPAKKRSHGERVEEGFHMLEDAVSLRPCGG
jgi:hypothetical protein